MLLMFLIQLKLYDHHPKILCGLKLKRVNSPCYEYVISVNRGQFVVNAVHIVVHIVTLIWLLI